MNVESFFSLPIGWPNQRNGTSNGKTLTDIVSIKYFIEHGWGSWNISKTQGPLGDVCETNRYYYAFMFAFFYQFFLLSFLHLFLQKKSYKCLPFRRLVCALFVICLFVFTGSTGEKSLAMTPASFVTRWALVTSPLAMTIMSSLTPWYRR